MSITIYFLMNHSNLYVLSGVPTESVETYKKAQARIDLVPGMSDRIRLFMLPEPIFSRGPNNQFGITSGTSQH